jgi:hypothetical protein
MATATKRAVAMETRMRGKDVGNGKGSKSVGKGGKSNGNGNEEEGNCQKEGNEWKRRSGRKSNLAAEKNLAAVGCPMPPDSGRKSKKDEKVFCSTIWFC